MSNISCTIKRGWFDEGKTGVILETTPFYVNGMSWTAVLWDDEEDPDFFKTSGLDFISPGRRLKTK